MFSIKNTEANIFLYNDEKIRYFDFLFYAKKDFLYWRGVVPVTFLKVRI